MFSLVAVSAQLAEQLVAIETGGDDAVHQARTRVRRLRSILSVYKKAFDREEEKRLRERLKGLGDRLGRARDLEVRALALAELAQEADDPVEAGRARALTIELQAEQNQAVADLLHHLSGRGHRRLLADLQAFAADPPLSEDGTERPGKVMRKGLKKALKRVRRAHGESLEERHETRKAARRLRYAAEAVADDLGRDAVHLAANAEAVQDALGDHRDLVLLARQLREHDLPGLAQRCEARAEEALVRAGDALTNLLD